MKTFTIGYVMLGIGLASLLFKPMINIRPASSTEISGLFGGACAGQGSQSAGCDPADDTCTMDSSGKFTHVKKTGQMEAVCSTTGASKSCGTCGTPMQCVLTETGCDMGLNTQCQNCQTSTSSSTNTACALSGTCTM
jgi:hypothetical protein